MVREVLCDCGVSRLWLEGIPPAWTIPVMRRFRNQRLGVVEPRREMEVKGFRIACGEFIGVSMWAGKSWKIQEWLGCHKEFPVPKVCLPRAAGAVPWNRKSAMERGVFFIPMWSARGRIALFWWRIGAKSASIVTP